MAKNTFATLGILAVLLMTFGLTSAEYTTESNNVTLTIYVNALTNVSEGETYNFDATVENLNASDYYVVFGTTGWTWTGDEMNLTSGSTENFTGTLTIPASGSSKSVIAKFYDVDNNSEFLFQLSKSVSLTYASTTPNPSEAETFCEFEGFDETGDLEISDFDVRNNGEGSDDEWQYLDDLEIIVEVENTDNEDIEDVEVKIMILDAKMEDGGADVTNDFDVDDEIITDIGRLRDDDQEEVIFLIEELSSDLEEGTYYMYIMAYEDGNEDEQCNSEIDSGDFYFSFEIESVDYEDSVLAKGKELEQEIDTYCGHQNLEIEVPIYNLGGSEEEKVLVNIYSSSLGIDEYRVIDDLDNGDKEVVNFFIDIPEGLTGERYNLEIFTSFDWDDDRDEDDETSYDEKTTEVIKLNILGCAAPAPAVSASLESETNVGSEMVVKAQITNEGDLNNFMVTVAGFEDWAELVSVTPSNLEIASGASAEVTITLSPKESGVNTFQIVTAVDGETYTQAVSVSVGERQYPYGLGKVEFYLLVGIIALAILILLVLIAKATRRRPAKSSNY